MTASVIGREKTILSNLVNNNNVRERIAQFNKNTYNWVPPQTFATGFWANREKSGSTLTLYEDIVSSDSDDEEPPLSHRYNPSCNSKSPVGWGVVQPPQSLTFSGHELCQQWLAPLQSAKAVPSKWDARAVLSTSRGATCQQPALTKAASSSQESQSVKSEGVTATRRLLSQSSQLSSSTPNTPAAARKMSGHSNQRSSFQPPSPKRISPSNASKPAKVSQQHVVNNSQMYAEHRVDRKSTAADPRTLRRSSSMESIQANSTRAQPTHTYKTEVRLDVQSFYSKGGSAPVPAPRRVHRAKSSATSRPLSLQADVTPINSAPASVPTHYRQKTTHFPSSDNVEAVEPEVTDVNLFNVNEDAVLITQSSNATQKACRRPRSPATVTRNLKNLQDKQQQQRYDEPAEIIPRNSQSDHNNIEGNSGHRYDVGETDPFTKHMYENVFFKKERPAVSINNNTITATDDSVSLPLHKETARYQQCSWPLSCLSPIEFQTQCAQVCYH